MHSFYREQVNVWLKFMSAANPDVNGKRQCMSSSPYRQFYRGTLQYLEDKHTMYVATGACELEDLHVFCKQLLDEVANLYKDVERGYRINYVKSLPTGEYAKWSILYFVDERVWLTVMNHMTKTALNISSDSDNTPNWLTPETPPDYPTTFSIPPLKCELENIELKPYHARVPKHPNTSIRMFGVPANITARHIHEVFDIYNTSAKNDKYPEVHISKAGRSCTITFATAANALFAFAMQNLTTMYIDGVPHIFKLVHTRKFLRK